MIKIGLRGDKDRFKGYLNSWIIDYLKYMTYNLVKLINKLHIMTNNNK